MSVLKESYTTGDTISTTAWGTRWEAQTFTTTGAYTIDSVRLKLLRLGTIDTVTVRIRDTSAGVPSTTIITSGTADVSGISTVGEWVTINLTPADLSASTLYAISIHENIGDGSSNYLAWRYDEAPSDYAGGTARQSNDSENSWSADFGDFMFETYGFTTEIKTINGLAYASIKTVNGLAIASVKTKNDLV